MIVTRRADSTCSNCGFQMRDCECGKKRNTSGEVQRYQHHTNPIDLYNDPQRFSETTSIPRYNNELQNRNKERKFISELIPLDGELVETWIKRTRISTSKTVEDSTYLHIWGTSKTWPSHNGDRYCPVCILAQQLEYAMLFYDLILEEFPEKIKLYCFRVTTLPDLSNDIKIIKITA